MTRVRYDKPVPSRLQQRLTREQRRENIIEIARQLQAVSDDWTMPDVARAEKCSLRLVRRYFTREELCEIVRKPA